MPKSSPGAGETGRTRSSGGEPAPESWFWERREWSARPGADDGREGRDHLATLAVVLGALGLCAVLLGQGHHYGGWVDAVVATLALGGTLAAVSLGGSTLVRTTGDQRAGRVRRLGVMALTEGWLAVVIVFVVGLLAMR